MSLISTPGEIIDDPRSITRPGFHTRWTMRAPRSFLNLILLAATLLFIEGAAFLLLKLMSNQPNPTFAEPHLYDPFRGHRLNPLYSVEDDTQGQRVHSVDGFRRDDPVPKAKLPKTIRIIALGGSALYGAGEGSHGGIYPYHPLLRNDETITHFLETNLNRLLQEDEIDLRVEVINAATTAYHTFQHLVYLNSHLLEYRPDWVINLDGNNDFYGEIPSSNGWQAYGYSSPPLIELVNDRSWLLAFHLLVRAASPYSQTFRVAEKLTKKAIVPVGRRNLAKKRPPGLVRLDPSSPTGHSNGAVYADGSPREGAFAYARRTYIRSLWQINKLGDLEGFGHLVFLQPQVVFEDASHLSAHDREVRRITVAEIHKNWEMMKRVRQVLPAIFEEYGLPFYDVAELGPHNEEDADLYLDYCHLTPQGARLVANRISAVLYGKLLEREGVHLSLASSQSSVALDR